MESDELPILDSNVDFREVPPLHQKRTIAFVNHFIIKTVSFLNTFASSCESRLMDLECKLEKIEASLLILESQLASIPWLDDKQMTTTDKNVAAENDDLLPDIEPDNKVSAEISVVETKDVDGDGVGNRSEAECRSGPRACEDSRFVRFFKMVQFGVPPPAVKLKMKTEGLDPNILDNPNDVIAGYETVATDIDSDSSSS